MGQLGEYLESVKDLPFEWGRHDCLTFANGACKAQRGTGFADEWLGGYTTAQGAFVRYTKAQKRHPQYDTIIDVADDRLYREMTLHPRYGMIVARPVEAMAIGYAFGVCVGPTIAFVDDAGLGFYYPSPQDMYWSAL